MGEVKAALGSLNDSLIRRVKEEDGVFWRFRHPTVRDAFASFVATDPELIDIYLAGVTTARLLKEVTCGDVDMSGARIVITSERFSAVLERLKVTARKPMSFFDPVSSFLADVVQGSFFIDTSLRWKRCRTCPVR